MLTPGQASVVAQPPDAHIFLEGLAGAGKTTAAIERMLALLQSGVPGDALLVLAPQRTLTGPYQAALRRPAAPAGGAPQALTVGGLARRLLDLFWPVVAGPAGFARPDDLPVFLTLETAQYYMAWLTGPLIEEQGLFESVHMDRNRLYSQLLDNLNKSAIVGFPLDQLGERLKSAWIGEPAQLRIYDDVQICASIFRRYCLDNNLLDFSLQVELFRQQLWLLPACRAYLQRTVRHLIFDNLEEDSPLAHDLLREWLPELDSALLVYDREAGYRSFLGADPDLNYSLKGLCDVQLILDESLVMSSEIASLSIRLPQALGHEHPTPEHGPVASQPLPVEYAFHRFSPEMVDWVAENIHHLVADQGLPPGEIAVLAPFLSDALRFALADRLAALGVPARSHRPSRPLSAEPASGCLLTLAALAHPQWQVCPTKYDVAYALLQAIDGLDLVRAQLLAEIVYRVRNGAPELSPFERIRPEVQERLSYRLGERYEALRLWLATGSQQSGAEAPELDHFLGRLFGEVLSQPGYGFHSNFDAGRTAANLIESVCKFRQAAAPALQAAGQPVGREYLAMVQDGVIAAQYLSGWQDSSLEAVLLAPAYTFLMSNRPVTVQFWLDVGSRAWSERLNQPLTHPYVLRRAWEQGRLWTDADEVQAGRQSVQRLAAGLLRRCRSRLYLGLSELNEQGYEQRGPLLMAFQRLLRESATRSDLDERG